MGVWYHITVKKKHHTWVWYARLAGIGWSNFVPFNLGENAVSMENLGMFEHLQTKPSVLSCQLLSSCYNHHNPIIIPSPLDPLPRKRFRPGGIIGSIKIHYVPLMRWCYESYDWGKRNNQWISQCYPWNMEENDSDYPLKKCVINHPSWTNVLTILFGKNLWWMMDNWWYVHLDMSPISPITVDIIYLYILKSPQILYWPLYSNLLLVSIRF